MHGIPLAWTSKILYRFLGQNRFRNLIVMVKYYEVGGFGQSLDADRFRDVRRSRQSSTYPFEDDAKVIDNICIQGIHECAHCLHWL